MANSFDFLSSILDVRAKAQKYGLKYSKSDEENVIWDDEFIPLRKGATDWYPYFEEQEIINLWKQIVNSLLSLQHQGFCHRGIWPQNIIVTEYYNNEEVGVYEENFWIRTDQIIRNFHFKTKLKFWNFRTWSDSILISQRW